MSVVDVNILIALFLSDHPHHDRVSRWWSSAADRPRQILVPDLVWVGFLRIVTDRRILETPRTIAEAWSFVESLVSDGRYRSSPGGLSVLRDSVRLAEESGARGNLVPDAYIAATAIGLGADVVTLDRDFRRFDGLRITEPA